MRSVPERHRPLADQAQPLPLVFFHDPATTNNYTLSLHDALPISPPWRRARARRGCPAAEAVPPSARGRSEEHTSELQSLAYLVCRPLLENKNATSRWHFLDAMA